MPSIKPTRELIPAHDGESWYAELQFRRAAAMLAPAGWNAGSVGRILHVGCGTGAQIPWWSEVYPRSEHAGFDIEVAAVTQAAWHTLLAADGEALPFTDRAFDLAIASHTFHHFRDPRAGMREVLRVARSLLLIEPVESPWVRFLMSAGVIAELEHGERISRFGVDSFAQLFPPPEYRVTTRTVLHKWHPRIAAALGLVRSRWALRILVGAHSAAEGALPFASTKVVALIEQRASNASQGW